MAPIIVTLQRSSHWLVITFLPTSLTLCPFLDARVLFSLPWPLCFCFSQEYPLKPQFLPISHTIRCRRGAGVMPSHLPPVPSFAYPKTPWCYHLGIWPMNGVSYSICIRSFLSTMQSFLYPSFSPIICNIHASYLLSVPDLYQASENYALWLLKFLMLLGIFVHSQENWLRR